MVQIPIISLNEEHHKVLNQFIIEGRDHVPLLACVCGWRSCVRGPETKKKKEKQSTITTSTVSAVFVHVLRGTANSLSYGNRISPTAPKSV